MVSPSSWLVFILGSFWFLTGPNLEGLDLPSRASFKERFLSREKQLKLADPDNFQIKIDKMRENPHRLFRAVPGLFYADIEEGRPSWLVKGRQFNGPIQGDCHLYNFEVSTQEKRGPLLYLGDLDESVDAPLVYDLTRFLVSLELETRFLGYKRKHRESLLESSFEHYLKRVTWNPEKLLAKVENLETVLRLFDPLPKNPNKKWLKSLHKKIDSEKQVFKEKKGKQELLGKEEKEWVKRLFQKRTPLGPSLNSKLEETQFLDAALLLGKGGSSIGRKRYVILATLGDGELALWEMKQMENCVLEKEGLVAKRPIKKRLERAFNLIPLPLIRERSLSEGQNLTFLIECDQGGNSKIQTQRLETYENTGELLPFMMAALVRVHKGDKPEEGPDFYENYGKFLMANRDEILKWVPLEADLIEVDYQELVNKF